MAKKKRTVRTKPEMETRQEDLGEGRSNSRCPVVGIGASAGGLGAFKKFFDAMPTDSGMAFVLVPHLDPDHESLMVELLARHTRMPVLEAKNGMPVEANHVFILPPNKYMTIRGGILRLTGPIKSHLSQTSIDSFLRSLADDQLEKSICIIFSGTGSHGTLGLKAIKLAGGMAMVQEPSTAEYDHMPRSAIATGLVDYILPVERMPESLISYARHGYVNGDGRIDAIPDTVDHLDQLLTLLESRGAFDFRGYRKKMLIRRVERRMGLNHFESMAEYIDFLRNHPKELSQLVKDLFISVTSFFRDPDAFQELDSMVIAPLIQSKEVDGLVRVWVPGCATGEEAYSIAILLLERLTLADKNCRVQIFGTDVNREALDVARHGIYPDSITSEVSPERLARFFIKVDEHHYQVNKQLRERVTFAAQNVIRDPPFTKLDLISCRNVLIYIETEVQKKLISLFHFALHQQGYLFLGSNETIGRQIDLFEPLSKKSRIFRQIGLNRPPPGVFPLSAGRETRCLGFRMAPRTDVASINFAELTQQLLLESFAPAAVLINRKYGVLYCHGSCANYLQLPAGTPTYNLPQMLRDGLRAKLRGAVHQAIQQDDTIVQSHLRVVRNEKYVLVRMTVKPVHLPKAAEALLLVMFEDESVSPQSTAEVASHERQEDAGDDSWQQLERELHATREDLRTTVEQMESSNEELRASNEEIMSINEELQSTNEELEASKEELQSLNEELNTVNNQLQEKVSELEKANNDVANLLDCTDIATVFLDRGLRIKRFTPNTSRMFNLIATDLGRPLSDIAPKFIDPQLQSDAEEVLRDLKPRENDIRIGPIYWYVRRVIPYRTQDHRIDGVVITFVDVTQRRQADMIDRRLSAIVESSTDAIFSKDLDGIIQTWNTGAERLYGYSRDEVVGRSVQIIIPESRARELSTIMTKLRAGEPIVRSETMRVRKDGKLVNVELTISPVRDTSGNIISCSVVTRDMTEKMQSEVVLRDRESRLAAILETAGDAIITIDHDGTIQSVNHATKCMFGYTESEMMGKNVKLLMPSPFQEKHDGYLARYRQTRIKHIIGTGREVQARHKNGTVFPVDLQVSEIESLGLFTGFIRDITRRKELEREVVEIASLQQRRIGQDLHDSVGQELTALSILAADLPETIQAEPGRAVQLAQRISHGLKRSQHDLRSVLQGLLPVPVETEGLMAALASLVEHTQAEGNVRCQFDCPSPISIADNLVATHLYLIAQEAVRNALKHANASLIRISLLVNGGLVLKVEDDGMGMPEHAGESEGLGLRIMQNRAALICAKLTVEPAKPSGTVVKCNLATKNK